MIWTPRRFNTAADGLVRSARCPREGGDAAWAMKERAARNELEISGGLVMAADAGATDLKVSAGGAVFSRRGTLLFAWRQARRRGVEEDVDINAEEAAAFALVLSAGRAALEGEWHR